MGLPDAYRTASGCVELRNHKGEVYSMLLSDKPATSPLPQAYTTELVKLICKNLNDTLKEASRTYLEKTIRTALNSCHGTIIAVAKTKKVPASLSDGVVLKEPLDVASVCPLWALPELLSHLSRSWRRNVWEGSWAVAADCGRCRQARAAPRVSCPRRPVGNDHAAPAAAEPQAPAAALGRWPRPREARHTPKPAPIGICAA